MRDSRNVRVLGPRNRLAFGAACCIAAAVHAAPRAAGQDEEHAAPPERLAAAARSVDLAHARANVRFLADDLCEGRAPGTRGGDLAALYLSARLEALGLDPGAPGGSWFQPVPLLGVTTDLEASRASIVVQGLVGGAGGRAFPMPLLEAFTASDETLSGRVDVAAPLVFVGYGIRAPEQRWDDYAGADVRGKVVLVLVNDPPSEDPSHFGGRGLTYYGRWTYKYEEAARQGALGAICIHRDDMAGYGWNVVRNSWGRERPYVDARGDGEHRLALAAWVRDTAIAPVLAAAGHDLGDLIARAGQRGFAPVDLGATVQATVVSRLRPFASPNVIGVLPGGAKRDEAVVFTAHYDHLGVEDTPPGAAPAGEADRIYNGAVDNASGCAAVLEVARMFKAMDAPPARSIVFLFVTAEEGGLRGSQYFAAHPTFAPEKIAANVNLDGLPVDGEPLEFEPLGYDRSTLQQPMERVARWLGIALLPDSSPEQGLFYRSDHFNFAKIGVPAINLKTGLRFAGRDADWGTRAMDEYRKLRYHQPDDEYDPAWDMQGVARSATVAFLLGAQVADQDERPRWNDGDEFARD